FENVNPELVRLTEEADKGFANGEIEAIVIVGSASPDGPKTLNRRLAQERAENVARFLAENTSIPAEKITVESRVADWTEVAELASGFDNNRTSAFAPLVVAAIGKNPTNPGATLRRLEKGHVWKWLSKDVFPSLRNTDVMAHLNPLPDPISDRAPAPATAETVETVEVTTVEVAPAQQEPAIPLPTEDWQRGFYVKTNLPAWLALWTNVGFEVDLAPHWSLSLPVYYSGFDYFKSTLKFRTFAIQPELRWWPQARNHGFFGGVHFGMAYYNVALDGQFRYQDHDGRTPALGGGIALGWRFRLNSNPNLTMEASIGGGIYHLDYDMFLNRQDGLLYGRRSRTFYGIDQAALSLTYRFGLGKRRTAEKKGGEL
ncbi:MAG: DUF3575 domain-containing protein, partial [Muribaculaceae bacterium]|nr:DUF3575 domain-containing protein [Muribaculaceae bacterium]